MGADPVAPLSPRLTPYPRRDNPRRGIFMATVSNAQDDAKLLFTGPSPFGGHRYDLFDLCPRRYGLTYEKNPLPIVGEDGQLVSYAPSAVQDDSDDADEPQEIAWALIRGTYVHTGLAHHYAIRRGQQQGKPANIYQPVEAVRALHSYDCDADPHNADIYTEALKVTEKVVTAYMAKYAFERAKVIVVEEVFTLRLGESQAPYTFRLDLALQDNEGKVWMTDHKTTSRRLRDHGKIYGISTQFQAYAVGGQAVYGHNYGGIVVNMLEIPEDNSPIKFDRPKTPGVPGFLAEFPERIERIFKTMTALVYSGLPVQRWPRRTGYGSCFAFRRPCPFYETCRHQP